MQAFLGGEATVARRGAVFGVPLEAKGLMEYIISCAMRETGAHGSRTHTKRSHVRRLIVPDRSLNRYSSGTTPSPDFEARRQKTIDILTEAYASDLIEVEEYEARAAVAASARLPRELDDLVADIPEPSRSTERSPSSSSCERARGGRFPDSYRPTQPAGHPLAVSCVMGDRRMTGNWLDSDTVNSFTLMGSTRLDLRDADLPESGPIRIDAFVLMGEVVVIVPREIPVRMTATPFMGEATTRRDVDQNVRGARRWVEVSGLVLMGSVVVKAAD